MKICPHCQTQNREGVFFCEDCGQSLIGTLSIATRQFQKATGALDIKPGGSVAASWGTARFGALASVIIHVRDAVEPMTYQPVNGQLTLGRSDPATGVKPDIDMTDYGAQDKGVSRTHAIIRRGENDTLTLTDLGSVNGTFLNGQRLVANQPRILRDGDELRLGKIVMHIYFK